MTDITEGPAKAGPFYNDEEAAALERFNDAYEVIGEKLEDRTATESDVKRFYAEVRALQSLENLELTKLATILRDYIKLLYSVINMPPGRQRRRLNDKAGRKAAQVKEQIRRCLYGV